MTTVVIIKINFSLFTALVQPVFTSKNMKVFSLFGMYRRWPKYFLDKFAEVISFDKLIFTPVLLVSFYKIKVPILYTTYIFIN